MNSKKKFPNKWLIEKHRDIKLVTTDKQKNKFA